MLKVVFHKDFYQVYTSDPAASSGRMEAIMDVIQDHVDLVEPVPAEEKDLKNHLNAEPGATDPEIKTDENNEKTDNDKTEKPKRQQTGYRYGPLNIEDLMADNQVKRALEILISYNIFQNVKK